MKFRKLCAIQTKCRADLIFPRKISKIHHMSLITQIPSRIYTADWTHVYYNMIRSYRFSRMPPTKWIYIYTLVFVYTFVSCQIDIRTKFDVSSYHWTIICLVSHWIYHTPYCITLTPHTGSVCRCILPCMRQRVHVLRRHTTYSYRVFFFCVAKTISCKHQYGDCATEVKRRRLVSLKQIFSCFTLIFAANQWKLMTLWY